MIRKKIITIFFALCVILSMVSCTGGRRKNSSSSSSMSDSSLVLDSIETEKTSKKTDESSEKQTKRKTDNSNSSTKDEKNDYVLNTSTMKYHSPNCSSVKDISSGNRKDVHTTSDDLKAQGYSPCGRCNPR